MKTASTLFINTLAQLIAKIATTFTTLLVTYLLTHKYGVAGLGEFITATSYVALFYLLADFGINATFTKRIHGRDHTEVPEDLTAPDRLLFYFKNMLSLRLLLGTGVTFLALAFLSFLGYPAGIKIAIIMASLLIINQAIFITTSGIFQIKLKYQLGALAEISGGLVTLSFAIIFVQSHLPVLFIIIAYVAGSIVRSLVALFLTKRVVGGLGLGTQTDLWRSFFVASLPLGMIAVFSQIMANIDKVILSLSPLPSGLDHNNIAAVGVYGLAYKFFDVSLVIPAYVMNAAFPLFVQAKNDNLPRLKIMAKKLALFLVLFAVLGSIVGFILTPWFVGFFGKTSDLQGTIQSLRILLFGLPIFYLSALLVWLAVSLDKQRLLVGVYFVAAVFNIAANLALIPVFGYLASAWLTIITEVIIVFGVYFLLKK